MELKAIIVEDEQLSRDILKKYLAKYCPAVTVIDEAGNVDEALQLLRKVEIDLLFLDVEMPYGTAFDLLDQLGRGILKPFLLLPTINMQKMRSTSRRLITC